MCTHNVIILTGTSDSSIFRMATVVAGDVCTVCKVGFSSITLDIIHEDCSTPLSKVSLPQGSSYVSKSHSARKTPGPSLPVPYPSCLQTTVASVLSQRSSQTVPQAPPLHTSTRPSMLFEPPTRRIDPSVQASPNDTLVRIKSVARNTVLKRCFIAHR